MINVIASISVKAFERDAFIEIFKTNVPKVLEEEGCVEYSATVDFQTDIPIQETNANVVTVIEKWESLPHLEAHLTAPHMLCLLYTSPSPRDATLSRMPSSA